MSIPLLVNHLWQSSCVGLLAGLLAYMLRKNSPKVRYWVWLSASLKFLVPFALLVRLGSVVPIPARQPVSVAAPVFPNALIQIAEPFSSAPKATVSAHAPVDWISLAIGAVWAVGFLAITLARCRSWCGVRASLRAGMPIELPVPLRALITPGAEEPGVVGFVRPVLVLPAQLLERLNPRQLGAILAHELCHVRRRDNLFAAAHMVVEAIFWFHPLVWWIGERMVEERERACDEEVLRMGCEPSDYVGGILKVCRFYTESPLPCISGVTGADVKRRLRAILAGSIGKELSAAKKMTLAATCLAALTAPVLIGVLNAPAIRAQNAPATTPKFEVASIKRNSGGSNNMGAAAQPGGRFIAQNVPVRFLIGAAYNVKDFQIVVDGSSWINTAGYDIAAKAPQGTANGFEPIRPMLQSLLADRFKLTLHRETKELPVYDLVVAKGGLKLATPKDGNCTIPDPKNPRPREQFPLCDNIRTGRGLIEAHGVTMPRFLAFLSEALGRVVIDKTGFRGIFDGRLEFTPDDAVAAANIGQPEPSTDSAIPSIFTALQKQLGLKAESAKGPVEVLVIDHIERPTEN